MIEWYNKRAWNESITQGQIILECPVQISEKENGEIVSSTYLVDIIVVSQSCDLENRKIDNIVVAELIDLPMGNSKKDTLKKLEAINSNTMPRYHLIKRYSEDGLKVRIKKTLLFVIS